MAQLPAAATSAVSLMATHCCMGSLLWWSSMVVLDKSIQSHGVIYHQSASKGLKNLPTKMVLSALNRYPQSEDVMDSKSVSESDEIRPFCRNPMHTYNPIMSDSKLLTGD